MTDPRSPSPGQSIAICGGGLAGLPLATLLARHGIREVVFEARAEPAVGSQGLSLTVAPNGLAALSPLGVDRSAVDAGMATRAIEIGNHRGKRLARIDQLDADGHSADSVTIGRGVLTGLLVDA